MLERLPLRVPREHPSFAGHFPGQPVLPGVVLLSETMEALMARHPDAVSTPLRLGAVKFLVALRPGADLELRYTAPQPGERLRFELWRHAPGDAGEGVLAASGHFETASGPQA